MAHTLVIGVTESGKTTLARKLVSTHNAKNIPALVFDPIGDPNWPDHDFNFITSDQNEYLARFWVSRSCLAIIDEGSETIARGNTEMKKCLTKGRHAGHSVMILSQRGQDIDKTARDQCTQIALFRVSFDDARVFSNEFCHNDLKLASGLKKGEYFWANNFGFCEKRRIF